MCVCHKIFLFQIVVSLFLGYSGDAQIISTTAGTAANAGFSGDGGFSINARLNHPFSVAADAAGNIYIADMYNNRIRKCAMATGIITTIAGTGIAGFSGDDGIAVNAQINHPGDICVDEVANIYFVDSLNFRIRKVDAVTGIISTIAGNGIHNYNGQTVPAFNAGLKDITGIAIRPTSLILPANEIFFSMGSQGRIGKVNMATGILSTIAGTGSRGFAGDGGAATNASFNHPAGLHVTSAAEIFVADCFNHRIRYIDIDGNISTIAGNGAAGFLEDGVLAITTSLNYPHGVLMEQNGNVVVADMGNNRIRTIDKFTGIIYLLAGNGSPGFGGDKYLAFYPCVKLNQPGFVRQDALGNLYIADRGNNCIRKVSIPVAVNRGPSVALYTPETALNPIPPSIIEVCEGTTVKFETRTYVPYILGNFFADHKINGKYTGSINGVLTETLKDGDIVTAEFTSYTNCGIVKVFSNAILIKKKAYATPGVTIAASATNICTPATVVFKATPLDGGMYPVYDWLVNGKKNGYHDSVFIADNILNGDKISCLLISSDKCITEAFATSNVIPITAHPSVDPAVTIIASDTSICLGEEVVFNAVATGAGKVPAYQWKLNGINTGTNNPVLRSSSFQNGDIVSCTIMLDPALACARSNNALSNIVVMKVVNAIPPSIGITASANNICQGTQVNFKSVAQNAGNGLSYQWRLNGNITGGNSPGYSTSHLEAADQVSCVLLAPDAACPSITNSNSITMIVYAMPIVSIKAADSFVTAGTKTTLTALVDNPNVSYNWTPIGYLTNSNSFHPETIPLNNTTSFSIKVTSHEGCTSMASLKIEILIPLLMPTSFTPNSDGLNDLYRIPAGTRFTLGEFSIYDRWGNRIFITKDISKGWDGTSSGQPLPAGGYVYNITGILKGKQVRLKETFVLLR